jgi:anion-transporting  ArsA/GET3 family ATPase
MMPFSTTPMGAKGVLTFLEDPPLRLLLFGGKGGVGKTTGATAAALRYARRSPPGSFLLVSTDPAHSLTDSLGDFHPPPNLKVLGFNAQESLETFKARHRGKFAEIAARGTFLDEEGIRRILDLSLPGMDELMALLLIARWAKRRAYDLIVVDTAPPGHTLRLLTTPELIRNWLLFLNLATPAWDYPWCGALNHREALIKDKFQQTFAGREPSVIYHQREPRGLKHLGELGQALYRPKTMENRHGAVTDLPALSS